MREKSIHGIVYIEIWKVLNKKLFLNDQSIVLWYVKYIFQQKILNAKYIKIIIILKKKTQTHTHTSMIFINV